ncbi:MAG: putative cell survival pathways protein [Watsoniomyces obsoletus]|nr:MAG: putative cell survival pathways protein [Watsoniomyces obsoletus]
MLVTDAAPSFSLDAVTLYHTTEPLLSEAPILVFYGPTPAGNTTQGSWRIQAHIVTPAGLRSYSRITTSPNSALYAAVHHLPADQQGDEVSRGLAIALCKYFSELPEVLRTTWSHAGKRAPTRTLFDEAHAAEVASRMVKVENISDVYSDIQAAFQERSVSNLDVDLFLPEVKRQDGQGQIKNKPEETLDDDSLESRYGSYASLVKLLGGQVFLPTSRLQRAPSRPMTANRNKILSVEHENTIKREMCELLETEERYVAKLEELVNHFGQDVGGQRLSKTPAGSIRHANPLSALLPSSLRKILNINSQFVAAVRKSVQPAHSSHDSSVRSKVGVFSQDPSKTDKNGILEWAKLLQEWFPKFAECYGNYIRASGDFPKILSQVLKDGDPGLATRIRDFGEQRLRAALIEPVQRLPRYSLFIDNMTNVLPAKHPAMPCFLQARDIVANVCALQASPTDKPQVVDRLRSLVSSWPSNLRPAGRLISALDYLEVLPPYHVGHLNPSETGHILLLFADYLVFVRKSPHSSLTARGVMAEVDRPSKGALKVAPSTTLSGQDSGPPLVFESVCYLKDIQFSESARGSLLHLTPTTHVSGSEATSGGHLNTRQPLARTFFLGGSYEGRASRWTEEVAKARIEGRYPEQQRESENWDLRSTTIREHSCTLFTAITQIPSTQSSMTGLTSQPMIRLASGLPSMDKRTGSSASGLEISIVIDSDRLRLQSRYMDGHATVDEASSEEFLPLLAIKLADMLRRQSQARDPKSATRIITENSAILRSMSIRTEVEQVKARLFRPPSPVKLLSSFLSGGNLKDSSSSQKQHFPRLGEIPSIPPPAFELARSGSRRGEVTSHLTDTTTVFSNHSMQSLSSPFTQLEDTLGTYIAAIQSQAGAIAGHVLRSRWELDELKVNEVYNALLDNPQKYTAGPDVSVGMVFAAFEKFLKRAWEEQLGPVISAATLQSLQDRSGILLPSAFEGFFKTTLGDMTPQNQRAFGVIIKLLADLLDASGNDDDRGALTAAFAELLVSEGNPHMYISLLDRLVEDCDLLFEDGLSPLTNGQSTPATGSMNSRTRSINTGSISSNASSLRKRFALSRENSKLDADSKMGSVWRTLSKTARGAVAGESNNTKGLTLTRSKSTDIDGRLMLPPLRPISRDRPHVLGAISTDDLSRPSSSRLPHTPTTGGVMTTMERSGVELPRRKRRSSLSDLASLQNSPAASTYSAMSRRVPDSIHASPRTPSPVKYNNNNNNNQRSQLTQMVTSSTSTPKNDRDRDRPSPLMLMPRGTLVERATNIQTEEAPPPASTSESTSESTSTVSSATKKSNVKPSVSSIPTLNGGSIRGKGSPNLSLTESYSYSPTRRPTSSPHKARVQSPQKLRQRLQSDTDSLLQTDSGLQAELAKIGEDLSQFSSNNISRAPSVRPNTVSSIRNQYQHPHHANNSTTSINTNTNTNTTTIISSTSSSAATTTALLKTLHERISTLENKQTTSLNDLQSRHAALKEDFETSLMAMQTRVKKMDDLYREVTTENELLYERFNEELMKLGKALKGGGGGRVGGAGPAGGGGVGGVKGEGKSGVGVGKGEGKEGDGEEEGTKFAIQKWKDTQEEVMKLKKELRKVKRENVVLKSSMNINQTRG